MTMGIALALDHRARVEEFQRKHRTGLVTLVFTDMVDASGHQQRLDRAFHVQQLSWQWKRPMPCPRHASIALRRQKVNGHANSAPFCGFVLRCSGPDATGMWPFMKERRSIVVRTRSLWGCGFTRNSVTCRFMWRACQANQAGTSLLQAHRQLVRRTIARFAACHV